ncbi:hypothetical protein [Amycolatopsis sp.]|uniref:hypothetical protein n=1 Tax=Amycolatopsis sp. TaxID=37632 RepID=UPI002BCD1387|nr:hypothetical protein [Amycolatopsis sp.]HVV14577.1 hypothetical protein [Amycolatopsis sp.]
MHSDSPAEPRPRLHLDLFVDTAAGQQAEVARPLGLVRRARRPGRQPVPCGRPQPRAIRIAPGVLASTETRAGLSPVSIPDR